MQSVFIPECPPQKCLYIYLCGQVVRQSDDDQVTVIGAGVTLHEALAAADTLAAKGNPHCPLVDMCWYCYEDTQGLMQGLFNWPVNHYSLYKPVNFLMHSYRKEHPCD